MKISRGPSFQGLVSSAGMILLIGATALMVLSELYLLTIPFMILGLVLFIKIRGVVIDTDNSRIKAYLEMFVVKPGKWLDLQDYDRISLRLFNESQTMNMVSISNTHTVRTFDIYLEGENAIPILLKDFVEYPRAKKFLDSYAEKLDLPAFDAYADFRQRMGHTDDA